MQAIFALLADWSLIAASFGAAIALPHPLVYVLAAVLIARTQLALAVLMHDAAHGTLFSRRRMNDVIGQLCTAGPLFLSLFAYRAGHLQHHRAPMAKDDPVASVFQIADYPISRRRLALRLLADLLGIGYVRTLRRLAANPPKAEHGAWVLGSIVATNALLFTALALQQRPWLYVTLWILPALTILQVLARVRAIFEHAGYGPSADQRLNARTIDRRSWQTFLFGPHGVHYHIEHHVDVRRPFHRLPTLHRQMRDQLPAANVYRGYGAVLCEVSRGTASRAT